MVAYTVFHGKCEASAVRTTLHVEGEVKAGDWEKLRELCLDALKSCDELALDVQDVSGYDYSFSVLVCLLRRTVQLLGKRLIVIGKEKDNFFCVFEVALKSKQTQCSFVEPSSCCLWENLFTTTSFPR